jgi:ABC-type amino acid transport substrate-binding protein
MKKLVLVSSLAFMAFTGGVWAGNYTIGVEATDYLPISKGDAGAYSGYARELLDAFGAKYGHTFTYRPVPVARLYDEFLVKKSVDFKFPDNGYWAGDAKKGMTLHYSKGLVSVTDGTLVLAANKGKASSISKLGTLRGFTPFPYLDAIKDKKVSVTEANSADAAISMVEAGRVEGVYMGVLAANYVMSEVMKKPGVLVFDDKLPKSTGDFSLSTLAHPDVIKQMDEFLVKEKSTVDKLKVKYKIN